MAAAGMESLQNIRYNIHSHDSLINSHNGYVPVDYHSSPDFYHQRPTEEGPIDFSRKPNSEVRAKSPDINIERHAEDSERYLSGSTVADHLEGRNYGKIPGSVIEQHLRNGNGFTNGNERMRSPVFEARKFESKHHEPATSPSHFNAQSFFKIYYEARNSQKTNEDSMNRSQASSSQIAEPVSEDNAEHHLNAGHSSEAEYGSISALHHARAHYAYPRNSIDIKSEAAVNGSFPTHEFPKRSHSPEATLKREEYCPVNATNLKDFNFNKRHSAGMTLGSDRDSVAIDDNTRRNRIECSGMQSKSSPVKSRYGRKEVGTMEPDTYTRFQTLLSANTNPFVPAVYSNMGIMNSPNFPQLNPLSYPPAMLSGFNPFLSPNPLAHTLNPMSMIKSDNEIKDRPFKQFATELICGMKNLLPEKTPMIHKSYVSATEPTSSTTSPQPEKPKSSSKGRSSSTDRFSPSVVPQTSQLTPSDESVNSVSPTYHENDTKHSQPEQKEDDDSNLVKEDEKGLNDSNSSFSDAMPNNQQPPDTSCGNGRRRSLPDHMKNDLYWAKRRKNNAAAKRSRDARREKEDLLALTAKTLKDQNFQLHIGIATLQEQINFHISENKRLSEKCNNQERQIFRLKEDQERNQKLCRRCSTRILDADATGL